MAEQQQSNDKGLEPWQREALAPHQLKGIVVKRPSNRPVMWAGQDGVEQKLLRSEDKQQFLWCATGCAAGKQHYKCCTPDALRDPRTLLCCFCTYESGAWVAAGRKAPPPAEWEFMKLVDQQQQSTEWCWQVHIKGRHGRVDFYNWKSDLYLQVDDSYHFSNNCQNDVFMSDFECNEVCCRRRLALVRAHAADFELRDITLAAIETALQHNTVVFTASYKLNGMPHIDKLRAAVGPAAVYRSDPFGNKLVIL